MKVLFLTRSLECGGAERQLIVLAQGLLERGHEVVVVVFYSGGILEPELRATGVTYVSLEKYGRWDVFGFLARLVRVVRHHRPDLLHSYIGNLVTVLVQPFLPTMKIVWGIRGSHVDSRRYDWLWRLCDALASRLGNSADLIIANSHAGRRDHIAQGYPEEKIVVIPNGIDIDRFRPNPEARNRIRAEWGISQDTELIGMVARLDPMKDHENFLQAAFMLMKARNCRFVCVGNGPPEYRVALHERARVLGLMERIMWVDARSDVADIYNAFDILVSSSSFGEGFSNVIGEAMACGIPCVATDVGDAGVVMGSLGALVPPGDPVALMNGMERVLSERLPSAEIRRHIVVHYSLDTLIQTTERELLALCHKVPIKSIAAGARTLV